MEAIWQDVRFGVRMLMKHRLATLVCAGIEILSRDLRLGVTRHNEQLGETRTDVVDMSRPEVVGAQIEPFNGVSQRHAEYANSHGGGA